MSGDYKTVSSNEKIEHSKGVAYYPLPSNDEYEKFLQKIKKDQCISIKII